MRIRITAIRKASYPDLMAKYENPIQHTCDVQEGQEWISVDGQCPEGMCPSAWGSMREFVEALARGEGNFYDGWMKNPQSAMISCNDGFRPVSFYIEVIWGVCLRILWTVDIDLPSAAVLWAVGEWLSHHSEDYWGGGFFVGVCEGEKSGMWGEKRFFCCLNLGNRKLFVHLQAEKVGCDLTFEATTRFGEMPEWSIGAVSKTVIPSGIQGSNPCLSAENEEVTKR